MEKRVIIMRGPSGSGKGRWLKRNEPDARVVSADNYFMKPCGFTVSDKAFKGPDGRMVEYVFDPSKIALAHTWCMNEFVKLLAAGGVPVVAVDNTNTHLWEFVNYIDVAKLAGYEVEVRAIKVLTIADLKLCAERNLHGTPIEVVAKMAYEYEDYHGELFTVPTYSEEHS